MIPVSDILERGRIATADGEIFELQSLLGAGGMGVVYLAKQQSMQRLVALKMVRADHRDALELIQRLRKEAKGAALLDHPNIVKVFSLGVSDQNEPFLVMEYVEGKTLKQLISDGTYFAEREHFFDVFEQILDALHAAHEAGLVHRDISPNNIMISADHRVKLMDFGIAKHLMALTPQVETKTGELLGSPCYMSPEQCSGQKVGPSSDLYSLACVMFETLTGKPPFSGDTPLVVMQSHLTDPPPALPLGCGERLEKLLRKALAKDPAQRFANAQEMLEALQDARAADSTASRMRHAVNRGLARSARTLLWAAVVIAAAVATIYSVNLPVPMAPRSQPKSGAANRFEFGTESTESAEGESHRLVKIYQLTKDPKTRDEAKALAIKAIDRARRLHAWSDAFDCAYKDLLQCTDPANKRNVWQQRLRDTQALCGQFSPESGSVWKDYACFLLDKKQPDPEAAKNAAAQALNIFNRLNEEAAPSQRMLESTVVLIDATAATGDNDKAKLLAQSAIKNAVETGMEHDLEVQIMRHSLGLLLLRTGQPEAGVKQLRLAADGCALLGQLHIRDSSKDYDMAANYYLALAEVYYNQLHDRTHARLSTQTAHTCLGYALLGKKDDTPLSRTTKSGLAVMDMLLR